MATQERPGRKQTDDERRQMAAWIDRWFYEMEPDERRAWLDYLEATYGPPRTVAMGESPKPRLRRRVS